MLRIILIVLAGIIIFRLLSSIRKSLGAGRRGTARRRQPGGEVGEGWVVDEDRDENDHPQG